jgi:ribonuclease BN (tRNA processing enzyme)
VKGHQQIPFSSAKFPLNECLEITLLKGNHPEYTIAFRILERPTGRLAVVLTDNENLAGIPASLRTHLSGAHLLIADVQYSEEKYKKMTAGYGHGTPEYATWLALELGIEKVGYVHHDPTATDDDVDQRVKEGREHFAKECEKYPKCVLTEDGIFAVADYQTVKV